MANLPYDKHSAASIFEYSKGLLGKSLRAFVREDYLPKKGKGGIGQEKFTSMLQNCQM